MTDSYEQLSAEEIMIISCWRNYKARAQVRLLDYINDLNDNANNLVDTSVRNDLRKRVIGPEEIQAWKEKRIRPLPKQIVRCSFCNKRTDEVGKMISGVPGNYICNECVEICNEILEEGIGSESQ